MTKNCTKRGATIPNMFEMPLVIPISIPAWFGDMSTWLTLKPQKTPELNPTAITRRATALLGSSAGVKPKKTNAIAGIINPGIMFISDLSKVLWYKIIPIELKIFLVFVILRIFLVISPSDIKLMKKLRTHSTKYGNAESTLFCKTKVDC